jgi:hypothetical protein
MGQSPYAVQREHARYSLDVRARLSASGREITVRMLDVSEGGVGMISPVEIPEACLYAVEFVFPTMQDVFHANLELKSRNGFRYGFIFIDIDESNMALVRKYQRRWGIRAEDNYK